MKRDIQLSASSVAYCAYRHQPVSMDVNVGEFALSDGVNAACIYLWRCFSEYACAVA